MRKYVTHLMYVSKDGWKHSTPRLPKEVHFPKYNNADIHLYHDTSKRPPFRWPPSQNATWAMQHKYKISEPDND